MAESFDIAASSYDTVFTNSKIGKLQRLHVYNTLEQNVLNSTPLEILEINCGTGHDAFWFSKKRHKVVATDISSEMIAVAKSKLKDTDTGLQFSQLDINTLDEVSFPNKFDLIFSNFGGLNCLSPEEFKHFFQAAYLHLKPDSVISAVIMPKYCILETLYFLSKGNFKAAFRRRSKTPVLANVDGVNVKTWYYSPKDVKRLSKKNFKIDFKKPIGLFIPPSYLESFFKNKTTLLTVLNRLDILCSRIPFLASFSDHYIISLSKK